MYDLTSFVVAGAGVTTKHFPTPLAQLQHGWTPKGRHVQGTDSRARSQLSILHAVPPYQKLPDLSQLTFPDVPEEPYDLVVLGSGPAGETAASHAAQLGAQVAVVEIKKAFGGPTGLTSKAVREAAKQIIAAVDKIGGDRRRQIRRLWKLRFPALRAEAEVLQARETRDRLGRNLVDLYLGSAQLIPTQQTPGEEQLATVRVCRPTGCVEMQTRHVCIATGSRPFRPAELKSGQPIPWQKGKVIDATEVSTLTELPNAVAIVGGGVIAVEYATVLARLGVGVTILCSENDFMPFVADELRDALRKRVTRDRVLFLGSEIERIDIRNDGLVRVLLADKKRLRVDMVMYSGGRNANSEGLGCEDVGIGVGRYGRIEVDRPNNYVTANPLVHAVGDVIGPPGLASAAQQQARLVTDRLFAKKMEQLSNMMAGDSQDIHEYIDDDFFTEKNAPAAATADGDDSLFGQNRLEAPMTLWTMPEIASVGVSAEQAVAQGLRACLAGQAGQGEDGGNMVIGYAYFKDLARGRLSGDPEGFLKVLARVDAPNKHTLIGVHIFGEGANELIQMGSILVYTGATLEQVSNTPFAAVTLSGLYQMASDDALCSSPFNFRRHPLRAKAWRDRNPGQPNPSVPAAEPGDSSIKTPPLVHAAVGTTSSPPRAAASSPQVAGSLSRTGGWFNVFKWLQGL